MNKTLIIKLAIVVGIGILAGLLVYFTITREANREAELTSENAISAAISLLQDDLLGGGCLFEGVYGLYASCQVQIEDTETAEINRSEWMVMFEYDGLFDDSVRAKRVQALLRHEFGQWEIVTMLETQKCQPGRGSQEFSPEFCI